MYYKSRNMRTNLIANILHFFVCLFLLAGCTTSHFETDLSRRMSRSQMMKKEKEDPQIRVTLRMTVT